MITNIKTARKAAGLTQQQAADKLGVSVYSIQNWEQGKSEPDSSVIVKMAKLYGVTTDTLYGTRFANLETIGIASTKCVLLEDEQQLLTLYRSLTPDQQAAVLGVMEAMQR